jgi:hypothetical protein
MLAFRCLLDAAKIEAKSTINREGGQTWPLQRK